MCGIAGFFSPNRSFSKDDLFKMTKALSHRGPDAEGFYFSEEIGLGHRRLSILDLSASANQPMFSHDKRYIMAYNGEVYNYREIASEVGGNFKTRSDTEVILEAFVKYGPDFVHHLNGMFAIAIYDTRERELFVFRDRLGIKPLYYFYNGNDFAFASETKSLLQLNIDKKIDITSLKDYFFLEYVPGNRSIFKNIFRLENGFFIRFSEKGFIKKKYYDILEKYSSEEDKGEEFYTRKFEEHLSKSIHYQSISDVPIGAFLSGGTDSSLICAVFQKENVEPINTFTIGFDVKEFDESEYAAKVAKALKTNHNLTTLTNSESKGLVAHIVDHYDEPFAASSVIPSLIVCNKARKDVTVALSGDGGDELYMGYGHYYWYDRLKRINSLGSYPMRKAAAKALSFFGEKGGRGARFLDYENFKKIWLHIWSQSQSMFSEKEIVALFHEPYSHETTVASWEEIDKMPIDGFEKVSLFDIKNYLPNNLLYKMDIASMASSLEVRVPYLDHNLVEFAINVPMKYKVRNGEQKYIMKKVLEKYLPKELIYRKKWGFPAPMKDWLLKDLSFLINHYLNRRTISQQGIFDPRFVENLVNDFRSNSGNHFNRIWSLIFFQMWYKKYIDNSLN
jgi:asparagine synthase (glutamine-hydrolysing)